MEIVFKNAFYLWTLLIVPLVILIHFLSLKYSKKRAIKFANFVALARVSEKVGISSNLLVLFLRVFVFVVFILAISGTSVWYTGNAITSDYVIAIDSSASMLATDLEPTRIDVARETAIDFVDRLNPLYSSVSVVSFSGTPFVHQILTKNYASVKSSIEDLNVRSVGGTDIGNAIVTSSNILLSSDEPRIVILITDGRDNIGLSYKDGIFYANDNNVLVYVVGVGSDEGEAEGVDSLIGPLGIDEGQLKEIASETGGRYYRVASREDLVSVYDDILTSEKKKVSLDLTFILLLVGITILALEWVLINTRFRIIP